MNRLFEIANEVLDGLDVSCIVPHVTVLLTYKDNYYASVNDYEGVVCQKLLSENDTAVKVILTVSKNGDILLPPYLLRKSLIELDESNYKTDIILQNDDGYGIRKNCELTLI